MALGLVMRNAYEVLREKELSLARLRREVEALRYVIPLLADNNSGIEVTEPSHPVHSRNRWPLQLD